MGSLLSTTLLGRNKGGDRQCLYDKVSMSEDTVERVLYETSENQEEQLAIGTVASIFVYVKIKPSKIGLAVPRGSDKEPRPAPHVMVVYVCRDEETIDEAICPSQLVGFIRNGRQNHELGTIGF